MAWTESYHCDVCSSPRGDAEDWWLAFIEGMTTPEGPDQSSLRIMRWNHALSHSANVKHLCGARCAQTFMDRWMRSEGSQH